jgi:hypothetical protein
MKRLKNIKDTEAKLEILKRTAESKRRKLQNECRVLRLEEFRKKTIVARIAAQRKELVRSINEWQRMHEEDCVSQVVRTYLTCDHNVLEEVRLAFAIFDSDNSGTIDASEFQSLCFELGEIQTEKQVAEALALIDLDGSGTISLIEFAEFWVSTTHGGNAGGDAAGGGENVNNKMLMMKLKMLKRVKDVYGKMGGNLLGGIAKGFGFGGGGGGGGGAKNKKKNNQSDSMTPPSPEEKKGGLGGMMGGMFGGGGKGPGNRPQTV